MINLMLIDHIKQADLKKALKMNKNIWTKAFI